MIKRISCLLLALAACIATALPARAQVGPFTQYTVPYVVCSITTNQPTPCFGLGGPVRQLIGFVNNSATAQNGVTVTCYDYLFLPASTLAQITAAPIAATVAPLGATQIITWPPPGRTIVYSLTCLASVAPNGSQIEVYVR